jgi:1,4-dihydroxy-2-naphthoate octaprenyltransferase
MFRSSTIQLLRFHFSLFLLPVFLFALSQLPDINWYHAGLIFFILHFLVYPASNGYNSYMDRDDTPIGGLARPQQPTRQLFWASLAMDMVAVLLSLFISVFFAVGILFYILASRAYSYRGIRLKRHPFIGFLTVFIFQGAWVFFIVHTGAAASISQVPLMSCLVASLLIGALYPLTQIYQHEADRNDGVITISYLLGKRGSFIFSGSLFIAATALLFIIFRNTNNSNHFQLFCYLPCRWYCFFATGCSKYGKTRRLPILGVVSS